MTKQTKIIETIRNHAITTPEAICFEDETGTHTYRELISNADALAAGLSRRLSADRADMTDRDNAPVICFGGLSFDMIVSFMACIISGHPYIPVDVTTPAARAEAIRDTSKCCAIIATEPWQASGQADRFSVLLQEGGGTNLVSCHSPVNPASPACKANPISGDDNFYIIFTSGTTGKPKGVQISHDNLTDFTDWILRDFGLRPGMRFLLQAPFSFDLSVMSLWPALLSGGTLVTISKAATQDFRRLYKEMPSLDLNVWVSTPSFADLCLADTVFSGESNPHLSHFLFCGDELLNRTAKQLIERFPGAQIFNTYGPTEATVAVTRTLIDQGITDAHDRLPVGAAKPGTTIAIVGEDGLSVPDGTEGEIIIAGPQVSKGYLNDPEKTAEAFTEYNGIPAYRTGDAGVLIEGQLYFKGRLDFQVKLHGYRIELEGIEQHLLKNPLVADAIVVPEYSGHKVRRLVAYTVTTPQRGGENAEKIKDFEISKIIKKALSEHLPAYMIPQKFVYTDSLPLTRNGKVDRKRLLDKANTKNGSNETIAGAGFA